MLLKDLCEYEESCLRAYGVLQNEILTDKMKDDYIKQNGKGFSLSLITSGVMHIQRIFSDIEAARNGKKG